MSVIFNAYCLGHLASSNIAFYDHAADLELEFDPSIERFAEEDAEFGCTANNVFAGREDDVVAEVRSERFDITPVERIDVPSNDREHSLPLSTCHAVSLACVRATSFCDVPPSP
ncbi:MAG: hypothetical protein M3198_14345 [Actinomycetota bacterium]|nr:hypothetical protein [Actinomycetota bacterium]